MTYDLKLRHLEFENSNSFENYSSVKVQIFLKNFGKLKLFFLQLKIKFNNFK